jgi:hypothetical protein
VPAQNSRRQKGEKRQVPYWGSTNIGPHRSKFRSPSKPGARNLCTPQQSYPCALAQHCENKRKVTQSSEHFYYGTRSVNSLLHARAALSSRKERRLQLRRILGNPCWVLYMMRKERFLPLKDRNPRPQNFRQSVKCKSAIAQRNIRLSNDFIARE